MPVGPLARIGKKQIELLSRWMPSLAVFGGAAGSTFIYLTEWRVIAEYIPYYSGKFKEE